MPSRRSDIGAILLYDGDCGYCDAFVRWVFEKDTTRSIHFAPLNGPTSLSVLGDRTDLSTVILVKDGHTFRKSEAIFCLMELLPRPWSWLGPLRVLPVFLRNAGYDLVAAVRYRLRKNTNACDLPDDNFRRRLLP